MAAADAGLLQRSRDLQPKLPSQLMSHETADRFELLAAFGFVKAEGVAERVRFAGPGGTLKDVQAHGGRV